MTDMINKQSILLQKYLDNRHLITEEKVRLSILLLNV